MSIISINITEWSVTKSTGLNLGKGVVCVRLKQNKRTNRYTGEMERLNTCPRGYTHLFPPDK